MATVSMFLPSMSGTTGNTLWLYKSSDYSLVNTGGDALTESGTSGWFTATVAEAWTETLAATIKDTNSLPSGYGYLAVGATQIVDATAVLDSAGQPWAAEDVTFAIEKLTLLGVVADAVVVPAGTFMCGRGDIEQIFGTTAVAKWGDLNNNEDADEITGRINYRIAIADSFMRSTLGNSAWVLPVEGDAIPPILAYYTACLAGVLLYEGRGVQDYDARGNAQHQLSFHKKGVDDFVKGVLFGSVSLAPLEYNVASAAPEAT